MVVEITNTYYPVDFSLGVNEDNTVSIDWGDGVVVEAPQAGGNSHIYGSPGEYTITIRGEAEVLYGFETVALAGATYQYYGFYKSIDISGCTHLKNLNVYGSKLTSLDVSNNPLLEILYCNNNNLKSLDLSNNPLLEVLYCNNNNLSSLDVSNNPLLRAVSCHDNPFVSDQAAVTAFANSLPDRTGLVMVRLDIRLGANSHWIADICAAKNWDFR
jgi:hypothetical protein